MTFIDHLLINIVNQSTELDTLVSPRDAGVLRSLANSVVGQYFITENQSKLLIRILRETYQVFPKFADELAVALVQPVWSRQFRQIEQVKKLYIGNGIDNELSIVIEFTFSANVRKLLSQSSKLIENLVQSSNGKLYFADLTERNLVTLVDLFRPLDFEIDELVLSHYDTITSWSEQTIKDQFLITSITNQNFQKHITADLGIETAINLHVISDRSMRYQYNTEQVRVDNSLASTLANRTKPRVWVDKSSTTLTSVIETLKELKRLPVLLVFDNYSENKINATIETVSDALQQNGIFDGVGIYFRLPNNEHGIKFNAIIAENSYNQYLDADTQVVGVQSGKLPKFLLTSPWRPMSVIAIDTQLRNSKTAVYANCCDLIITYSDTPPITEKLDKWL